MDTKQTYKLNDDVIAHIAKTLQLALITGTDIVDNLRLLELVVHGEELILTPTCSENFQKNLDSMIEGVPKSDSPFSS